MLQKSISLDSNSIHVNPLVTGVGETQAGQPQQFKTLRLPTSSILPASEVHEAQRHELIFSSSSKSTAPKSKYWMYFFQSFDTDYLIRNSV